MLDDCYIIDFTGYSMAPVLRPGDRLVVRKIPPERVGLGDILVRRTGLPQIAAHRLVRRLPRNRGITKGDAMAGPDLVPIDLTGSVERVEAVVRQGRRIVFSSASGRWRRRWQARLSLWGISAVALKQRIKRGIVQSGGSGKFALARVLDGGAMPAGRAASSSTQLRAIQREGIAGILFKTHNYRPKSVQAQVQLNQSYRSAVAGNLACIGFMEKLEAQLAGERIPVMTLKGASLLNRCYPKVGLRPMADLDLMVRPEHRTGFERILDACGFIQNRWRTDCFQGSHLTVDLHEHPLHTERIHNRSHLLPGGIQSIWQRSAPWQIGFKWVRRPTDIDNVLLLCLHLLKHYYARLIWLEDLRRLLQNREIGFWSKLARRANALGCSKALAYSLYLLDALYPTFAKNHPDQIRLIRGLSRFEKLLLLLAVADRALPLAAPVLEGLAVKGTRQRRALALETLFPRQHIRRSEFGTMRPLQSALFVPRRLVQTLKLLLENLATTLRILGRAVKYK